MGGVAVKCSHNNYFTTAGLVEKRESFRSRTEQSNHKTLLAAESHVIIALGKHIDYENLEHLMGG